MAVAAVACEMGGRKAKLQTANLQQGKEKGLDGWVPVETNVPPVGTHRVPPLPPTQRHRASVK